MTNCPLECLDPVICGPEPDFLDKHSTFILTLVGAVSACAGLTFTYFLKSRCNKIRLGCIECDRKVIELDPKEVNVKTNP